MKLYAEKMAQYCEGSWEYICPTYTGLKIDSIPINQFLVIFIAWLLKIFLLSNLRWLVKIMLEIILNWKKSYVKEYDQILPNVNVFSLLWDWLHYEQSENLNLNLKSPHNKQENGNPSTESWTVNSVIWFVKPQSTNPSG